MPLSKSSDKIREMPAERGRTGKRGARGERGPAGTAGPQGPAGPAMARADILAVVEDQFYDVGKRLDGVGKRLDGVGKRLERQMTRTGEIQHELNKQKRSQSSDAP